MKGLRFVGALACAVLLFSAVPAPAQQAWEGSAVVGRFGDFPPGGLFAASNAFPRNSMVTVTDGRSGRQVRVIVVSRVDDPGVFLLLSPEAGQELGLRAGGSTQVSAAPVRSTLPESPVPALVDEPALSPDPDVNPAARIAELLDPEPEPEPVEAPRIAEAPEPVEEPVTEPTAEPEAEAAPEITTAPSLAPVVPTPAPAPPAATPTPTPPAVAPAPAPVEAPAVAAFGIREGLGTASRGLSGEQPLPDREYIDLRPLEPIVSDEEPGNGIEEALARLRRRSPQKELFTAPQPDSVYTFIQPPYRIERFEPDPESIARARLPEEAVAVEAPEEPEEPEDDLPEVARPMDAPSVELEPGAILSLEPADARPPEAPSVVEMEPEPEPAAEPARDIAANGTPFAEALSEGAYYLQIGAYSNVEGVEAALSGLDLNAEYPYTVVPGVSRDRTVYRVFVGPLEEDEKGRALFMVRARGYRDAFVRRGG
ncbi:MAG: SPOR domain-containing protein [Spirochaetaceae bacterium]|nr:MAG: SPOR domain-containing protein [Spirochaetaceae bacterium]